MTFDLATLDTAKVAEEGAELRVEYQTIVIAGQKLMFCGIRMDMVLLP